MPESAPFAQVQDLSAAFVRLVEITAPGIVTVQSNRSRSSGFFWRPGLIVTADEALSEEGEIAITCTVRTRRLCRDGRPQWWRRSPDTCWQARDCSLPRHRKQSPKSSESKVPQHEQARSPGLAT